MSNVTILLLPWISLSLMGCTITNTSPDASNIKPAERLPITKGKSNKQDVMKLFGKPTNIESDNGGIEKWIYSEKTTASTQTMWMRTPIPSDIENAPNIKVTNEIKGEGTNQVQKVLVMPVNEEAEVTHKYVVEFDGDTVADFTIIIEHEMTNQKLEPTVKTPVE